MALRPPRRTTLEGAPRAQLAELLAPHRGACIAAGVDVDALADASGEEPIVALYKAAQLPGALPVPLREALSALDTLASAAGADAIDFVARERGVVGLPVLATPAALACHAYVHFPDVFAAARVLVSAEAPASAHEHWPLSPGPIALPPGFEPSLRAAASEHFRGRRRSGFAEVLIVERGDDVAVEITRGDLRRDVTEISDDDARRQHRAVRPARRDLLVLHRATGMLAICTAYAAERDLYRRVVGTLLHGQADAYAEAPTVCLEPLLSPLSPGPSVRAARVVELDLVRDGQPDVRLKSAGGLAAYLDGEEGRLVARAARVRAATLSVDLDGGTRVRVELRVPNVVRFGHADKKVESSLRAYLAARGVLVRPPADQAQTQLDKQA